MALMSFLRRGKWNHERAEQTLSLRTSVSATCILVPTRHVSTPTMFLHLPSSTLNFGWFACWTCTDHSQPNQPQVKQKVLQDELFCIMACSPAWGGEGCRRCSKSVSALVAVEGAFRVSLFFFGRTRSPCMGANPSDISGALQAWEVEHVSFPRSLGRGLKRLSPGRR